jgi:predicted O-methyltransferase YrrM
MKTKALLSMLVLLGLTIGFYSFHLACAKDGPDFKKMESVEKWKYRAAYIDKFKRIGLNTTPGDATLLRILVQTRNAQRGVEIGTATGFGALHMGMGFEETGGHLYTLEIDPEMVKNAQVHLNKTGLQKTVTILEGDALKVIPGMEGGIDFVFIDAVKKDYLKYLQAIEPMLLPGAVIVADNVVRFHDEVKDFMDYLKNNPKYDLVTIRASDEKRDGVAIIFLKE